VYADTQNQGNNFENHQNLNLLETLNSTVAPSNLEITKVTSEMTNIVDTNEGVIQSEYEPHRP
jgi:hypothetical protein